VLRVDELQRAGVEVICLTRELGRSPEDDLLRPVQGMMAEDERVKLIARPRRGKRYAARAGMVNVLRGAPSGYRDMPKDEGRGPAHDDVVPDEARVVRPVFDGVGRERGTIGAVGRRRTRAGEVARTGTPIGDRRVVWGMRKNPAYLGAAAFGPTRQGPLQRRRRAQRGRPLQPKRAVSSADVPAEQWLRSPGPALLEPELFEAVPEPLREQQRHARQSRRGALDVLQGLVPCGPCHDASYGKRLSPSARTGHPRTSAYDRGLGTAAYRFGGARVGPKTQVRTALLELAVWQEVGALLAHPERLAEEDRRRAHADRQPKHTTRTTRAAQLGKRRQGLARLIDRYTDGRIDKPDFEPRLARLRQRIAPLAAPRQQLAEAAALHTDLRLIIGRLEDLAAQVQEGLAEADWHRQRALSRALVRRVEVAHDHVQVVFRIEPRPGDPSPEKKRLQDCRRSNLIPPGECVPALCACPVVSHSGQATMGGRSVPDSLRR
jgi:site-specific DNA recombinase